MLDIIHKLESPPHNFKCCYDERDFEPGKYIPDSIVQCINESVKSILVLSPEFLESSWCIYERNIILDKHIATRGQSLIPVMLRRCEVPELIKNVTYIDIVSPHFWDRLVYSLSNYDIK